MDPLPIPLLSPSSSHGFAPEATGLSVPPKSLSHSVLRHCLSPTETFVLFISWSHLSCRIKASLAAGWTRCGVGVRGPRGLLGTRGPGPGAEGGNRQQEETGDGWLSCHLGDQILSPGCLSSFALDYQEVSARRNELPDVGRQRCCEEGVAVPGSPRTFRVAKQWVRDSCVVGASVWRGAWPAGGSGRGGPSGRHQRRAQGRGLGKQISFGPCPLGAGLGLPWVTLTRSLFTKLMFYGWIPGILKA